MNKSYNLDVQLKTDINPKILEDFGLSQDDIKEHVFLTFDIRGISRAAMQEHARHQHLVGISAKSSRYTLQELTKEKEFNFLEEGKSRAIKYIVFTGDEQTDCDSISALENLRKNLVSTSGKNRDRIKYSMPECYKIDLVWTVNLTALENYIKLRTSKAALWEIQTIGQKIKDSLPSSIKTYMDI